QVASKAWFMADYYGYDREQRARLYLAASLHDIGKLAIPTAILEKPGKLTDEEFSLMKKHVRQTWDLLKDIEGFDRIAAWAAGHHEKLDGSGYPHGKTAEELDFNCRLLACIDIYQAVSEERPYHLRRNHEETMRLMNGIARGGKVDAEIVRALDVALAPFDGGSIPHPVLTD
ncbi:MAG: HD domain-containing protein, partial [Treponema sp.]|nr:HD domain-containing protein [Treponema sp.]